jgi:hypothetical protein
MPSPGEKHALIGEMFGDEETPVTTGLAEQSPAERARARLAELDVEMGRVAGRRQELSNELERVAKMADEVNLRRHQLEQVALAIERERQELIATISPG